MKIVIEFSKDVNVTDKEKLKEAIDKEDFNDKLKFVIDNEKELRAWTASGRLVYTIGIDE